MAKQQDLIKTLEGQKGPERGSTLKALIQSKSVRSRFEEMLGKKAAGFMSSILSAQAANGELAKAEPMSIISAAAVAASLDLPINASLGFAHIVPYKGQAQFQLGWKGFVQLAMRSGQYETINAAVVHEGELIKHDPFTGEMTFDAAKRSSNNVIGYVLYFKLLNGFRKYFYMTRDEAEAHGKRYSRSYQKGGGLWASNFEAMALKTVVKLGLSKYGILSIEMQKAIDVDQAVVDDDGNVKEYVDQVIEGEATKETAPENSQDQTEEKQDTQEENKQ